MKKAGLIIFVIGILITVFTGINYVSKEVVLESGDLSVVRDASHGLSWSPIVGILVIILGVGIFIGGVRRRTKMVTTPFKN